VKDKQGVSYSDWWKAYGFEAMVTVRIPQDVPLHEAHKLYISDVLRPLALHMKTKLAAYTVIVPASNIHQKHLHSLVLSNNSGLAGNGYDGLHYLRSSRNTLITHEHAVDIEPIFDLNGACDYVANHITDDTEFIGYNDWLIKKRKHRELNQ
jgi:hypothetical protein